MLLLSILFLGVLLIGTLFVCWKAGEWLAEHGGKLLKVALVLTVLALMYVAVSLYVHPLPGVNTINDAIVAMVKAVKNHVG